MPTLKRSVLAIVLLSSLLLTACFGPHKSSPPPQLSMDQVAESYVRQVLALGEYDPDGVDAYYGPSQWRDQEKAQHRSVLNIRNVVARLYDDVQTAPADPEVPPELWELRKRSLKNQIGALEARARMLEGWKPGFDDESLALFDVAAKFYGHEDFKPMLETLDQLLPKGEGSVSQRYNRYIEQYAIPKDKLEAVMLAAIEVSRQRTLRQFRLPAEERFELALVNDKPWSAHNHYQGNFVSRIAINTDQRLTIARAIELAAREGYPGHHAANVLVEDQLVRARGWREYTVASLYSPASFIAEGAAGYGVQLAFPIDARLALIRYLFGLAGFNTDDVERYDGVTQAARPAGNAVIEAARRYRDGQASATETNEWLQTYALATPERAKQEIAFIDRYGATIINDAFGENVIRDYVERNADASEPERVRWRALFDLLTQPHTPQSLLPE